MKYSIFILILFLASCNSNKSNHNHSHDDELFSHENVKFQMTFFEDYTIEDKTFGTKTEVQLKADKRIMTTNSLPNHKTGEFPNLGNPNTISKQQKIYEFPLNPKYTGKATWVREPGIALNGIKFEPQTAEVVTCDTGENYRVEAIQNVIDLGLDFNHAHVQPTGAYHYHGTPKGVIEILDTGKDLVHIGFAHDGFPMYYSKSGLYKPSYKLLNGKREGEDCTYTNPHNSIDISVGGHHDGTYGSDFEFIDGQGDLDECNGITIDGQYMYLVTNDFPYVGRCLMGVFEAQGGERDQSNRRTERGERPNLEKLLEMMDINKDKRISKTEAKGRLSQDFDRIDTNKDGYLVEDELVNIQRQNEQGPRRGRQ